MFKTYQLSDLPAEIPLFPLAGVVLLPRFQLPLNIFEVRYLAMVDDALQGGRMIGMAQPKDTETRMPPVYEIGCAGRITGFEETDDGRYLLNLTGVCRFRITQELPVADEYRRVVVDWAPFITDLTPSEKFTLDRNTFMPLLHNYFQQHDYDIDWTAIEKAGDEQLINTLTMVCPFDAAEKQALLEAADTPARAEMMQAILAISTGSETAQRRLH